MTNSVLGVYFVDNRSALTVYFSLSRPHAIFVMLYSPTYRRFCETQMFVCFLTSVIYESLQVNTFLLKHCSEPLLSVILRGFVVFFFCDYLIKISQQNLPHCDSDSITTLNEKRGNV